MRIEPRHQPLLQALLDELKIKEPVPGAEESLDDLVPFSSYASEDPMEPRFTLPEEEAKQKTPFDLMILALRRIFELVDLNNIRTPWKTDAANEQWQNLKDEKFFYRHYWKGELLEWIHNITDEDLEVIKKRQFQKSTALESGLLERTQRCVKPLCCSQDKGLGELLPFRT